MQANVVQKRLYIKYCRGKCCTHNVVQEILDRNLLYIVVHEMLYRKYYTGECCTGAIVRENAVQKKYGRCVVIIGFQ